MHQYEYFTVRELCEGVKDFLGGRTNKVLNYYVDA